MALSLFSGFQDPFTQDFERSIGRAFEPMLSFPRMMGPLTTAQIHPMDIVEHNDRFSIVADAPGMTPDDISIELTDKDTLVVTGEKSTNKETTDERSGMRVHRNERTFNSFTRSFMLPQNAQKDNITAKMDNGVLTVDIPKKPEDQTRSESKRIKVTGSANTSTPQQVTSGAATGTTTAGTTPGAGMAGAVPNTGMKDTPNAMAGTTPEAGDPTATA